MPSTGLECDLRGGEGTGERCQKDSLRGVKEGGRIGREKWGKVKEEGWMKSRKCKGEETGEGGNLHLVAYGVD